MDYLSVRELAAKFAMPERTVYYHTANSSSVRWKKQGRKKLFHVADFAAVCEIELPQLPQNHSSTPWERLEKKESSSSQELQLLQIQNREKDEEITTLKRLNTELETTRNKFIQLHTEEKNEKKAVQEKLDQSQVEHHREIQKYMVKLHLAIGVAGILLVVLLVLHRNTIRPQ